MSDFKSKFKQAAAARTAALPTKEQLKQLKSQQKVPPAAVGTSRQAAEVAGPGPSSLLQARQTGSAPPARGSQGLPSDFFEAPKAQQPTQSAQIPTQQQHTQPQVRAQPAAAPPPTRAGPTKPGAATAALPEGFFADKAADAAARGVKLPDAKSKEAEFQEFTRAMEEDLKTQAAEEADEADEDAQEKEEREQFEHMMRMQRLEALKAAKLRAASGGAAGSSGAAGEKRPAPAALTAAEEVQTTLPPLPSKKRRVLDVLQGVLAADGSSGSGSDDDDDNPGVLDWRAKTY